MNFDTSFYGVGNFKNLIKGFKEDPFDPTNHFGGHRSEDEIEQRQLLLSRERSQKAFEASNDPHLQAEAKNRDKRRNSGRHFALAQGILR